MPVGGQLTAQSRIDNVKRKPEIPSWLFGTPRRHLVEKEMEKEEIEALMEKLCDGNWREDTDLAWNDYLWGDFDRTDGEETAAKDRLFGLLMRARDIQLVSVGRRPRTYV